MSLTATTGTESSGQLGPDTVSTVPCVTLAGNTPVTTKVAELDAVTLHPGRAMHMAAVPLI